MKFGYAVLGFTAVVQVQAGACPNQARIGAHDLVPFSYGKAEANNPLTKKGVVVDRHNPNRAGIAAHDLISLPFPDHQERRVDEVA
jgi:hypothetical protein